MRATFAAILSAISIAWSLWATPAAAQDATDRTWILLVKGKSTEGVPREEIEKKQKAHIDNFKRLAEAGQLYLAGPVADPTSRIRGIVMVAGHDANAIDQFFEPDPYVKEGYMKMELNPIGAIDGEISLAVDPSNIEEFRIAFWSNSDPGGGRSSSKPGQSKPGNVESSDRGKLLPEHLRYWQEMKQLGRVGLRARFTEGSPRFGAVILPKASEDELKSWLDNDPMVQHGLLEYQLMPQYLSKGVLGFK